MLTPVLCSPGGSHYMLLDEISDNLHKHGHEVHMLLQVGSPIITGVLHTQKHIQNNILQDFLSYE